MGRTLVVMIVVVAMVAFAFAINAVLVNARTRTAMARDGGHLVDTGVVRANVKTEGEGPPLVLIHGFGAALNWWDRIAPELARHHQVIRLDMIGHGGTEAPASGYSIERQAASVSVVR